jgi:hypothetical protein
VRERASASPAFARRAALRSPARGAMPSRSAPLREMQEWFAGAITHPGSIEDGAVASPHAGALAIRSAADVDCVLTAGPRLSAMDRLALYHDGYHARLIECLADDYPALKLALGEAPFEALCRGYIAAHPSRSPSLNAFGRHMAEHVRGEGGELAAFAADLARLEWAIVEAIHAEERTSIASDALGARRGYDEHIASLTTRLAEIAPEDLARATLPPSGAARVLHFAYPVNRFFQAFRDGEVPAIPPPERSATAVYRRGYAVWRMDLTPAMSGVLEALFAGANLETALAAIAAHAEDDDAIAESERNVMMWFREWVAGGFFARVALGA